MVKRAATISSPTVPSKIKFTAWGSGKTMYRVHDVIYAVDQFNPSPKGNARFSPILDLSRQVIPTLYAATTPRGALMESVFHDVPYRAGFKHIDAKRLEGKEQVRPDPGRRRFAQHGGGLRPFHGGGVHCGHPDC